MDCCGRRMALINNVRIQGCRVRAYECVKRGGCGDRIVKVTPISNKIRFSFHTHSINGFAEWRFSGNI